MDNGRKSFSLDSNNTEAVQAELPKPIKLSPWVRVVVCLVFVVVAVTLGIAIGYVCRVPDFEITNKSVNATKAAGGSVVFSVDLVSVDAKVGTMSWDWYILETRNVPENTTINIFFDTNLLRTSSDLNLSNNIPDTPVFRYNTSAPLYGDHSNIAAFRISIALLGRSDSGGRKSSSLSSLQRYPFDVYDAQVFLFAMNSETGTEYAVDLADTEGIAVGFEASVVRLETDGSGEFHADISISRGGLVKSYVIIIVIVFWVVTLLLSFATLASVFLGYGVDITLLVIPVSTLFAFTQLRSTMPGAPEGFGAIVDYVGLLPCLSIMSLSAAVTMGALVFSNPTKDRETIFHRKFPAGGKKAANRADANLPI